MEQARTDLDQVLDGTTEVAQEDQLDNDMIFIDDDALFDDFKALQEALEEESKEDEEVQGTISLEEAVRDFQNGNTQAFDYIFNCYERKIRGLAYRMHNDELSSELFEVLLRASSRFDDQYKTKFNTYFWRCAQNHIGSQRNMQQAQKRGGAKNTRKVDPTVELSVEEQREQFKYDEQFHRTKTLSLNYVLSDQDADAEFMSIVEDESVRENYDKVNKRVDLENLLNSGMLKEKEAKAIRLICQDPSITLERLGDNLGGVSAPAIHVMFKRLKDKPVAKHLYDIVAE